ncbi:peptidase M10A and M12B matrixin and adamalysin [[Leptolyngbya] sp. PCC 7376]|uniref:matrixin family metalloprotease n=1 Tax=[Leptolyngbya] sp. PCC 7376 TaxID=111781 RepID=UPI00029F3CAB|nr:matrixin family metalloprotease [[Leptolyngbya] sp. PCC 7376]AFY38073.1 peptidase M10A and M12B matrixin and adamalysin [[Leptolyngbya] sp. PCC 7376]
MQLFCYAWRRYRIWWRFFLGLFLSGAIALCTSFIYIGQTQSQSLPALATHPLPETLVQWQPQNSEKVRDYFAEIKPSPLGHLIWSEFPITVFYSKLDSNLSSNQQQQQTKWQQAVQEAIAAWSVYLPIEEIEDAENADIIIWREPPPIQITVNPETGERDYSFGRNAETRYRFYLDDQRRVRHQMTIYLSPHQRAIATLITARHELGHALGIWGHSNNSKDALYVSQTSTDNGISEADINTLKRIYQQPTKLGWSLP